MVAFLITSGDEKSDCRLAAAACDFQGHEAGDRDGEIELPEHRLEIGQAAGERVDRHDVAITGRGQGREAEIKHCRHFAEVARGGSEIGKGGRAQLPNQAKRRGKDSPKIQLYHGRALKAVQGDTARRINRKSHHPGQRREGNDIAAAAKHACSNR